MISTLVSADASPTALLTTGISPFFATCGYDLLIAVYPDAEVMGLRAKHFAINFNKVHKFLRDRM